MKSLRKDYNNPERIQLLVSDSWWDGTMSGFCLYKNIVYIYTLIDSEPQEPRIYGIYKANPVAWHFRHIKRLLWNTYPGNGWDFDENNYRSKMFDAIKDKNLLSYYNSLEETYKSKEICSVSTSDKDLVGYFDNFEFKFRKTITRDYFLHEEPSPVSLHNKSCGMSDFIEFRSDANAWHGKYHDTLFDDPEDWDGKAVGWSINICDNDESTYWVIIENCPWCKADLSRKPSKEGDKNVDTKTT